MVFSEEFDRALCLIMMVDKKNRDGIVKLVYDMPEELYFRIVEYINNYLSSSCDLGIKQFSQARRDVNTGDSFIYRIEITPKEIKIDFNSWSSLGNKLEEKISLSLFSISYDELLTIDDSLSIGNYSYNSSQFLFPGSRSLSVKGDEKNYEVLEKTPLGLVMCTSDDDKSFKVVSLNNIPLDIKFSDLKDKRSVNRLVRGRRKK